MAFKLPGMAGSRIPVVTAHGEGRAVWENKTRQDAARWLTALRFVDHYGKPTERFPFNTN